MDMVVSSSFSNYYKRSEFVQDKVLPAFNVKSDEIKIN